MSNLEKAVDVLDAWQNLEPGEHSECDCDMQRAAEAIKDAGLLAPDLPSPVIGSMSGTPRWFIRPWVVSTQVLGGFIKRVWINEGLSMSQPHSLSPDDARQLGLALIAASDCVERQTNG